MIVGFYQCPSPNGDLTAGFASLETALGDATAAGVDMLVMPELFLPGYGATPSTAPESWENVEERISALCRRHGTALTIGLPEYDGARVYNTAVAFGAGGEFLARYRKIQLFGPAEKDLYQPGDRYVVFEYRGKRWGLLICYDIEFPEHVRALARASVDVVLVPTANMLPYVNVSQFMVPSRAAENGVAVVNANYCGSEGHISYAGMSVVCGPDGYPLVMRENSEGLGRAELPEGCGSSGIALSRQLIDFRQID